jgi:hypothetical protein
MSSFIFFEMCFVRGSYLADRVVMKRKGDFKSIIMSLLIDLTYAMVVSLVLGFLSIVCLFLFFGSNLNNNINIITSFKTIIILYFTILSLIILSNIKDIKFRLPRYSLEVYSYFPSKNFFIEILKTIFSIIIITVVLNTIFCKFLNTVIDIENIDINTILLIITIEVILACIIFCVLVKNSISRNRRYFSASFVISIFISALSIYNLFFRNKPFYETQDIIGNIVCILGLIISTLNAISTYRKLINSLSKKGQRYFKSNLVDLYECEAFLINLSLKKLEIIKNVYVVRQKWKRSGIKDKIFILGCLVIILITISPVGTSVTNRLSENIFDVVNNLLNYLKLILIKDHDYIIISSIIVFFLSKRLAKFSFLTNKLKVEVVLDNLDIIGFFTFTLGLYIMMRFNIYVNTVVRYTFWICSLTLFLLYKLKIYKHTFDKTN